MGLPDGGWPTFTRAADLARQRPCDFTRSRSFLSTDVQRSEVDLTWEAEPLSRNLTVHNFPVESSTSEGLESEHVTEKLMLELPG